MQKEAKKTANSYKLNIYSITNIVTNKRYIGWTVDIYKRIQKHFRDLNTKRHHSCKLQRSFNKHGRDAFIVEILEKDIQGYDQALLREAECITYYNSYNNGYNMSAGGEGVTGHFKEKHWNRVEIYQYDLQGNFITSYPTKKEAYKQLIGNQKNGAIQFKKGGISLCKNKWILSNHYIDKAELGVHRFSLDGVYIDSFYNPKSVELLLGFNSTNVIYALDKQNTTYKGFQWKRVLQERIPPIERDSRESVRRSQGKPLMQLDKDTNEIIKRYDTHGDAIREYGYSIIACLRGRTKTAYGFKWEHL